MKSAAPIVTMNSVISTATMMGEIRRFSLMTDAISWSSSICRSLKMTMKSRLKVA